MQWVPACFSISTVQKLPACPGDTRTPPQSSNVPVDEPEQVERETQLGKDAKKRESEAWLDFEKFQDLENELHECSTFVCKSSN